MEKMTYPIFLKEKTIQIKLFSSSPPGENHGNESGGEGGGRRSWSRGGLIQIYFT